MTQHSATKLFQDYHQHVYSTNLQVYCYKHERLLHSLVHVADYSDTEGSKHIASRKVIALCHIIVYIANPMSADHSCVNMLAPRAAPESQALLSAIISRRPSCRSDAPKSFA